MILKNFALNGIAYKIKDKDFYQDIAYYEGRDLTDKFTWAELSSKIKAGDFSGLRIGDYKTVSLIGGQNPIIMQIAGIDNYHSFLNVHHIDWILKDSANLKGKWTNNSTNNGNNINPCPYMGSFVKETLDTFYNQYFPVELKNIILNKMLNIEYRYEDSDENSLLESNGGQLCNLGKLWIPTEYEVFGDSIQGTKCYSHNGAQYQYELFKNNTFHRSRSDAWWLATVGNNNSSTACSVEATTALCNQSNISSVLEYVFGFRI